MRNMCFSFAKSNARISCAVTKQLISILCFSYMDSTIPLLPDFFLKSRVIIIGRTPWLMSDIGGNSEDRFSTDMGEY